MAIETYDPVRSFKFHVTIDIYGADGEIGFQKVSGLKEASDIVEYREGNMMIHKRKLPGLTVYDPITLTRGFATSKYTNNLLAWRGDVARYGGERAPAQYSGLGDGVPADPEGNTGFRSSVQIEVFDKGDPNSNSVRKWLLHKAWPSELSVSDLNAEGSEMLIDTMVLQHEGMEPVKPVGFMNL